MLRPLTELISELWRKGMPTAKVTIRMWNKDGYHKDVAILDSDQVRMTCNGVGEPTNAMILGGGGYKGPSVVVNHAEFPEAVCFEVVVSEYPKR